MGAKGGRPFATPDYSGAIKGFPNADKNPQLVTNPNIMPGPPQIVGPQDSLANKLISRPDFVNYRYSTMGQPSQGVAQPLPMTASPALQPTPQPVAQPMMPTAPAVRSTMTPPMTNPRFINRGNPTGLVPLAQPRTRAVQAMMRLMPQWRRF